MVEGARSKKGFWECRPQQRCVMYIFPPSYFHIFSSVLVLRSDSHKNCPLHTTSSSLNLRAVPSTPGVNHLALTLLNLPWTLQWPWTKSANPHPPFHFQNSLTLPLIYILYLLNCSSSLLSQNVRTRHTYRPIPNLCVRYRLHVYRPTRICNFPLHTGIQNSSLRLYH